MPHCFSVQCYCHHRDLHSFPTRRSSDLSLAVGAGEYHGHPWEELRFEGPLRPDRIERPLEAQILPRSEEHTSELQSHSDLVCRPLLEKKNARNTPSRNAPITYAAKKQTK